jgi:hypothetical protein
MDLGSLEGAGLLIMTSDRSAATGLRNSAVIQSSRWAWLICDCTPGTRRGRLRAVPDGSAARQKTGMKDMPVIAPRPVADLVGPLERHVSEELRHHPSLPLVPDSLGVLRPWVGPRVRRRASPEKRWKPPSASLGWSGRPAHRVGPVSTRSY